MSDQPENLALRFVRRIDAKVDRLAKDMQDVRLRLTALAVQVGNLASTEASHDANTALRTDRIEQRLDRMKRRLDSVPAP